MFGRQEGGGLRILYGVIAIGVVIKRCFEIRKLVLSAGSLS